MNVEQEFTQEEIQRRAKKNSELYFQYTEVGGLLWNTYMDEPLSYIDPEESYWW